jgi:hypothetical protein
MLSLCDWGGSTARRKPNRQHHVQTNNNNGVKSVPVPVVRTNAFFCTRLSSDFPVRRTPLLEGNYYVPTLPKRFVGDESKHSMKKVTQRILPGSPHMVTEGFKGSLSISRTRFKSDKRDQKFNSCVILHKNDEETFTDFDAADRKTFLRVIQPWQTMAANIAQCKVVSSSSLHGLMLHDEYGVPSRWIQQSKAIFPFKFLDYFDSAWGIRKTGY